jgi:CoA-transferase family III
MFLVAGILVALVQRARTGQGDVLDVAIVDGVCNLAQPILDLRSEGSWTDDRRDNLLDGGAPFYRTYACRVGEHVAVGALEPQFHQRLLAGLGLDEESLPGQAGPSIHEASSRRIAAPRCTVPWAVAPLCGVRMTLGIDHSADWAGRGSIASASRQAPARRPSVSRAISSCSLMIPPRDTQITKGCAGRADSTTSPTRPVVDGVSGAATTRKSARPATPQAGHLTRASRDPPQRAPTQYGPVVALGSLAFVPRPQSSRAAARVA